MNRRSHSNVHARSRRPLRVESLENRRVLATWHNAVEATDVDGSGSTEAFDALLVLNELTLRQFSSDSGAINSDCPNVDGTAPGDFRYLDVTDDASPNIAPQDALLVINALPTTLPTRNVFSIAENSSGDSFVGQIDATVGPDTIFELTKDSNIPESIRDILALKPDDHIKGAADAPVLIIEYVDFACPICGLYHPLTQNALEGQFDGDVAIVTRHLPLTSIHPNAQLAAVAAEAAGRQGMFDEMADLLFERRLLTGWDQSPAPLTIFRSFAAELGLNGTQFANDMTDPALVDRVTRDANEAVSGLGFTGTPSFVVNDQAAQLPGATQANVNNFFQDAVDDVTFPFKIDRLTGAIRVREGAVLDFEAQSQYTFDVTVNGTVESVTINITDIAGS